MALFSLAYRNNEDHARVFRLLIGFSVCQVLLELSTKTKVVLPSFHVLGFIRAACQNRKGGQKFRNTENKVSVAVQFHNNDI